MIKKNKKKYFFLFFDCLDFKFFKSLNLKNLINVFFFFEGILEL
jgi:hypothetical protein